MFITAMYGVLRIANQDDIVKVGRELIVETSVKEMARPASPWPATT